MCLFPSPIPVQERNIPSRILLYRAYTGIHFAVTHPGLEVKHIEESFAIDYFTGRAILPKPVL